MGDREMSPLRLDHVTLSSGRMDDTVAFYGEILRMRPGFRPPLEANGVKVGGVWLYADGGDYPILHIIDRKPEDGPRSEEHTSELQSLMRISYADFSLKKKRTNLLPLLVFRITLHDLRPT